MGESRHSARKPESAQGRANAALWERGDHVAFYANRELRPVEIMILVRYRESLSGRVLELGSGAGRLTGFLAELARDAHGLDISPRMVEHSRRAYPSATFDEGDLRDLSRYESGSFDAVFASFNVLDVLDHGERGRVLGDVADLLRDDGLLILSTHNLAYAPTMGMGKAHGRSLLWLATNVCRLPRRMRNRRRHAPHERRGAGYAIVNDPGHDYATLHYHVSRDEQARQLADHGVELVACLDLDGRSLGEVDMAPHSPELHYIGRRRWG